MKNIAALGIIFNFALLMAIVHSQQAPVLREGCYPLYKGFAMKDSNCTCKKADPNSPGEVKWILLEGTLAKQISNPQTGSSVLIIEPPSKYAKSQTYVCRHEVQPGQAAAETQYSVNFLYGPESATLRFAKKEQSNTVYLCPTGETKELRLLCEVPASTVHPAPVYTVFVGEGRPYGGYDKLGGDLITEEDVYRLSIVFRLKKVGKHQVRCNVRNMIVTMNWYTLQQNITVSDQPAPPGEC